MEKALGLEVPINIAAKINAGPIWVMALIDSSVIIETLQPDQALIKSFSDNLGATGVVIGALKPDNKTYKVRTFAPSVGVELSGALHRLTSTAIALNTSPTP